MVKEEASTPSKSEKASSPVQEQNNMHAYPNWAAVQAYYGPGPGVNLPPQYFNPAVASGHPPHPFMWPQMMSPYGTPYAAMYPPGGVYGHPPFLGPSTQAPANSSCPVASEVTAATPLSMATPTKSSSSSKGQSLLKRLKGANGNAVSNSGSSAASHSEDCRTEGSSAGSDDKSTEKGDQTHKKKKCEDVPSTGKHVNALSVYGGASNATSSMAPGLAMVPSGVVPSPSGKTGKIVEGQSQGAIPSAHLTKDERELKRERRKQSNRESARRSRLRKQAEAEELSVKVASLNAENLTLRTEINQLKDNSEKLRVENESLMEKLSNALPEGEAEMEMESQQGHTVNTENFLSRVETSLSNTRVAQPEIETNSNEHSTSGTKLHQLLGSSPRTDPVAAS
ncbi:Common plant regulatory factor [Ranunculus cassubicifolius]